MRLIKCRPSIETRAPLSNEQFHRETTGQSTLTTEATSFASDAEFDQWDVPAPPRQQVQRPASAPSRSSNTAQVQRPSTVEDRVVAEPPRAPVQSDSRFSQQQDTLADIDYRDAPVDELATSEPTADQFADYEIFEDRKLIW